MLDDIQGDLGIVEPQDSPPETTPEVIPEPAEIPAEPTATPNEGDGQKVPYERFKEVNDELRSLREEINSLKKPQQDINNNELPEWQKPEWQPQSWDEVINLSKQQALAEIEAKQSKQEQVRTQLDEWVGAKTKENTSFNEDTFFKFAKDFPIGDMNHLNAVYGAYQKVQEAEKRGIDMALKVKNTPEQVSKPNTPSPSAGESDYSRVIKSRGQDMVDVALEAYNRRTT